MYIMGKLLSYIMVCRTIVYWGPYWGPSILGSSPYMSGQGTTLHFTMMGILVYIYIEGMYVGYFWGYMGYKKDIHIYMRI